MKNTIVLKKVSVSFNKKNIINDISFSVVPENPLCIIGTGSSGKSSLLKAIMGLIKLESGEILIDDISLDDKRIKQVLNKFGVVFQKDALFDSLKVWENIMFRSLNKKPKDELIRTTFKILDKVGLEKNDAFLSPSELSGGMRKRVAIARAISHKPNFLILDEPTAGLDPIKTNVIFEIIKRFSQDFKTTLIVVTSDMKGAIRYFKQFLVLKDCGLHWMGTVSELKRKPTKHISELLGKNC
ncbi:MAG: ABC transporter ATP-binding protein [Alphaproteobacteria bacterium]|tara:strand:- start:392 stop:1114 length:723 start_codon:yes stop_codon:yes gene_type:complete